MTYLETLLKKNTQKNTPIRVYARVFSLLLLLVLSGCASTDRINDPLESFNRPMQTFNDNVDTYAIKPIAEGYAYVFPEFFRKSLRNAYDNIAYPIVFINQFLQGKWETGLMDVTRFLFNSTFGLAGLFDIATEVGLPAHNEDFGQTFAVWGFDDSPYLVLPLLGPMTIRDGVGNVAGYFTYPISYIEDDTLRWSLFGTGVIVERERLLEKEKLIVGDRYLFIRDAYLQRRQFLINDGQDEDDPFLNETRSDG
jgi:phospholipid-binding lipoprotein MlaA